MVNWEGTLDACFGAGAHLHCGCCSAVQLPWWVLPALAYLQAPETWLFTVRKASEDTQHTCSSQIHFHSALLLVAFYYSHVLAGLLFQFEYKAFYFQKLLSVDFCWDNCLLFFFFWYYWDYRFSNRLGLSVPYDFLINCPILRQGVPSSWPPGMGIRWEESPGFNGDGHNWSKDYSCLFLLYRIF